MPGVQETEAQAKSVLARMDDADTIASASAMGSPYAGRALFGTHALRHFQAGHRHASALRGLDGDPHDSPAPRLDQPALRVVRMSGAALTEGIEPVEVPVFNEAKTVVGVSSTATRSARTWHWKRCTMAGRSASCPWMRSSTTPRWTACPMSSGPIWKASPCEPQTSCFDPRPPAAARRCHEAGLQPDADWL